MDREEEQRLKIIYPWGEETLRLELAKKDMLIKAMRNFINELKEGYDSGRTSIEDYIK